MIFPELALTWYFHSCGCKDCPRAYKKYGLFWIKDHFAGNAWHIWGYI